MKTKLKDIYWLAGLLEGEGCFDTNQQQPRIRVNMNDPDTIVRAAVVMGRLDSMGHLPARLPGRKGQFTAWVTGNKAAAWMMTLYPLMSKRRQSRIREVLTTWKFVGEQSNGKASPC